MVRSNGIVQDAEAKALLRFEQPVHPSLLILFEFQKKLSLMAPVGDMPYMAGKMVSIRSCHFSSDSPFVDNTDSCRPISVKTASPYQRIGTIDAFRSPNARPVLRTRFWVSKR